MLRFVLVLPIALVLLYLALIFESIGFALLGFSAVVFAVLSFVFLLYLRGKVKMRLVIPAKVADRAQGFTMRLEVLNKAFLPLGKIKVFVRYGERTIDKKEKMTICPEDVPRGESVELRRLSISEAGYYEFQIKKFRVYDPVGLFYLTKRGKSIAHAMILPELCEVPVRIGGGVKLFYGESMEYDDDQPGMDPSEIFDVREFRDGDKLQRIHWKLSARMDDLMVKEDSMPKACAIVLFFPEGCIYENGGLDYLASLSYTLMDAKCAHYVAWQSQSRSDVVRMRVQDEESFYEAITTYMQDVSVKLVDGGLERYDEKYKGERYLHSVLVDGEGTLWLDGEDLGKAKAFREELFLR